MSTKDFTTLPFNRPSFTQGLGSVIDLYWHNLRQIKKITEQINALDEDSRALLNDFEMIQFDIEQATKKVTIDSQMNKLIYHD